MIAFTLEKRLNLVQMGKGRFSRCFWLQGLELPSGLNLVTPQAFCHCSDIPSVTFEGPSSIESFDARSFEECASLPEISIPRSIVIIFEGGFI
jgi:hypothetical protein